MTFPVNDDAEVKSAQKAHLAITRPLREKVKRQATRIDELEAKVAELELLAFIDPLTGLMNRRPVLDRLGRELRNERDRCVRSVAVLALDLVGFKGINDTLGHDAGDAALKRTAGFLQSAVRSGDLVARWGGDEFVVVLFDPETAAVVDIVERLLDQLSTVHPDLSARIGAVVWERSQMATTATAASLIERADENERTCKRNQLALFLTPYS